MIDIDELIRQSNELVPLPATTVKLARMASSPDCHIDDVADLIAFDQGLTVRLLRAVNSAAEGNSCKVTTAREAVLMLGTARVMTLAVAGTARPLLQGGIPAYGLDEGALWRHSVASAVVAETSPRFCKIEIPPESFTAALLHDVGKLVMGRFISPDILDLIHRAQEVEHIGRLEAETLLLNVHHGELGGLIAQHWKLPPRVVQAIIHHHNPDEAMDAVCDVTYVSNQIAKQIEEAPGGEKCELDLLPSVMERLKLQKKFLADFCQLAASRYAEVSQRYNAA